MSLKKDDLDYIIRDALHGMVDNLEVHERVKKKIDRKITERLGESSFPYKQDGKIVIEKNENALVLAYLKLNECYIREVKEEDRSLIMIGFEAE